MKDINSPLSLDQCIADVRKNCADGKRVVFVSGDFNIVHPGHLRLFNYAAGLGDRLVVGVNADGLGNTHIPEEMRVEGVQSIGVVDHAFILHHPPDEFIRAFRPHVVVKGREYTHLNNPEQGAVDSYGGKLLFSSGDVKFSSLDLLQREASEGARPDIRHPAGYARRHNFQFTDLHKIVNKFTSLKVVVLGDLIIDEFVTCEALGMSQEDPTVVVSPIKTDRFIGGAGIVAAHASRLGANVKFFTVASGELGEYAARELLKHGVEACFLEEEGRSTTLKRRYRARGKTLLRVNQISQDEITRKLVDQLLEGVLPALDGADLLVFSDFNYGCLPQCVVDALMKECRARNIFVAADSQSSSQLGDIGRFEGAHLITPTEREARLALRDFKSGLVVLAENLLKLTEAEVCFVTLGQEGLLAQIREPDASGLVTDRLPAMNNAPIDVSGAGDSLLIAGGMALAAGASPWAAAYLGSIAAACQVSRLGNMPLEANEIIKELYS